MRETEYKNLRVLILGLGLYPKGSGAAAARYFARAGAKVTVTDKKTRRELGAAVDRLRGVPIRFVLGRHRAEDIRRADLVVRNPGVRSDSPELKRARRLGIPIVSDVSIFFRRCPAPIVGITGTRGKSTTSALVAEMLKGAGRRVWLGGNIQVSPLDFMSRVRGDDIVVLELSSWMLETLREEGRSPHVAVLTNVMRDHLNTYRGMKDYAAAKAAIFEHQYADDVAVVNRDNAIARKIGRGVPSRRMWFSKRPFSDEHGAFVRGGAIIFRMDGRERRICGVRDVKLSGEHNLENILAAVSVACALRVPLPNIRKTLRAFRGLHSRQEVIATIRGVRWVNDTTATTPDATIAALRRFSDEKRIILIAGGTDKKLEFAELAREIKRRADRVILLPGTATDKIIRALTRAKSSKPIHRAASMREAVRAAARISARFHGLDHGTGRTSVILSPGATSFGLFQNEFDRGDQFNREVRRLR